MLFIPKKYFNYLDFLSKLNHDHWKYIIYNTNLTYDCLDTMINTFHDSDSFKDYNPLYYIVNRSESTIQHTTDIFDKFNFN
jgi:hypothetical protein